MSDECTECYRENGAHESDCPLQRLTESELAPARGSVLVSDVKKIAEKIMAEAEAEARKWQDQGDTHGMNFHQGKRLGANWMLIEIEALNDRISDPAKRRVD